MIAIILHSKYTILYTRICISSRGDQIISTLLAPELLLWKDICINLTGLVAQRAMVKVYSIKHALTNIYGIVSQPFSI